MTASVRHKRVRRTLFASILGLLLGAVSYPAHAADFWGDTPLDALCSRFPAADRETLLRSLGPFLDIALRKDGIDPAAVRQVELPGLAPVLRRAARLGVGPLELFSDRQFGGNGPCTLFIDQATLAAIDREFDIHGLWMVRAPVAGAPESALSMSYMLLGQGRLIVGYPRKATVKVADYDIFTGQYDYQPYMAMDIVNADGRRALVRLRTLGNPSDAFQPFEGPLGAAIRELEIDGEDIVVRYRAWGVGERVYRVRKVPISLR